MKKPRLKENLTKTTQHQNVTQVGQTLKPRLLIITVCFLLRDSDKIQGVHEMSRELGVRRLVFSKLLHTPCDMILSFPP